MLRFTLHLFLVAWLSLLTAAAIQMHREPEWLKAASAVQGAKAASSPNLQEHLEQAVYKKSAVFSLNEPDVNRYLATALDGRQHGMTDKKVRFEQVFLDFEPGTCSVHFSWLVGSKYHSTASLVFSIERKGNQYFIEPLSGSYGRMDVPRGFMAPLLPALRSLCSSLNSEIQTVFKMSQVKFEKDRVTLDPRMDIIK